MTTEVMGRGGAGVGRTDELVAVPPRVPSSDDPAALPSDRILR